MPEYQSNIIKTQNQSIFSSWGFNIHRPLLIAGPCSVETEKQVLTIAQQIPTDRVDILRGGIWKPRTRPDSFEGVGAEGLSWLKQAGQSINKPVAVEVASPLHVEQALKAEIDLLWIGARTAVNPFAVQEVANALAGVNIPVFVKNPINPDLKLWIGAIERIQKANIEQVAAIHRGFSQYGKSQYRNEPLWQIVIDLRQELPELPIIVDPSHIAGNRDLLQPVAQQALDLGFDGLMIETHHQPDGAWSDRAQQITPTDLSKMLSQLIQRKQFTHDDLIEDLRETLSEMDGILLDIINERMQIAREIGKIKKQKNLAIYQPEQLKRSIEEHIGFASELKLSDEFIVNLFNVLHNESIRQQSKIYHKK